MAFDISELLTNNPWRYDIEIEILPVFATPMPRMPYIDPDFPIRGLSADELTEKAAEAANTLGLDIDDADVTLNSTYNFFRSFFMDDPYDDMPMNVSAVWNNSDVEIRIVAGSHSVAVNFGDPLGEGLKLPNGIRFTDDATEEQKLDAVKFLLYTYADFVAMDSPVISLFTEYGFYGERFTRFHVFDDSGSLVDRILSYNWGNVRFTPSSRGEGLWGIFRGSDNLQPLKIGEYPIITVAEARELLLLRGDHITWMSTGQFDEEMIEEHIAHVELVYRSESFGGEVFMPFYRFFIEMEVHPRQHEAGLKGWSVHYIPAVRGEFLCDTYILEYWRD